MTARPPNTRNRLLAAYEAALPASLFCTPVMAADTQAMWSASMRQHFALQELLRLAERVPDRTEGWAKVRKVPGAPHLELLWLAKDGERFLELLLLLPPGLVRCDRATDAHPRLRAIFGKMAVLPQIRDSPLRSLDILRSAPWSAIEALDAFLPPLRRVLFSRKQIERELLYDQRQAAMLARLRQTFNALARSNPKATVLRVELFQSPDATAKAYPAFGAQATLRARANWMERVRNALRADLLHVQEARQLGDNGNSGAHVMLVVSGRSQRAVAGLQDELLSQWATSAGQGAIGVSCKGADIGLYCRGRRWHAPGDSLKAELDDAALYFIYGGGYLAGVMG